MGDEVGQKMEKGEGESRLYVAYRLQRPIRDVFKLVRDFSIAPFKPSDSAPKFDGPLNQASQVRETESINKKQKQ